MMPSCCEDLGASVTFEPRQTNAAQRRLSQFREVDRVELLIRIDDAGVKDLDKELRP